MDLEVTSTQEMDLNALQSMRAMKIGQERDCGTSSPRRLLSPFQPLVHHSLYDAAAVPVLAAAFITLYANL